MPKGKNFSCNNTGKRKKSDFYETPYSLTQQFIDEEFFSKQKLILEPSCGEGAIVKQLEKNDFKVIGKDLITTGNNFLEEKEQYPYLITNPPFSLAYEFIIKAKKIITEKFALLLPLSYLHGEQRYNNIYKDKTFPLTKIYVFTRYPMLGEPLREDGKYHTGMMVYAWFVWEKNKNIYNPEIYWISNQKYVLSKKDT